MLKDFFNNNSLMKFLRKLFYREASLKIAIVKDPLSPQVEFQTMSDSLAHAALNELQNSILDRTLNRARRETEELKRNFNSHRAKAWMDGIMSDLVVERSKVQGLSKKISQAMREKEFEFKSRESDLTAEIRRLENEILLKSNSLTRSKEQLVQVALQSEKIKSGVGSAIEDAHYKTKFQHSQRTLDSLREENQELTRKFEHLRAQLNSIHISQQQVDLKAPSHQEYEALKIRLDRTQKQAEELKRTNEALSKRLKEQAGEGADTEAIRERLDVALKAFSAHKAEMDQLKQDQAQAAAREKDLVQALEKAHVELVKLREKQLDSSSGSSGSPGSSEVA